jgi:hypothetical protein
MVTKPFRWLHVLSRSLATGGHTALCIRWIESDPTDDIHDLALTHQHVAEVNINLLAAIKNRGGKVISLASTDSLIERAANLRNLSASVDAVVLHLHMWDVVPTIAFANPGGPPVLVVNHADHLFWVGSSIADLVLNIRPSGEGLCEKHRGCDRLFRLPIPLPSITQNPRITDAGDRLRSSLGIPPAATVFLTIGAPHKYVPTQTLSFFEAARSILTNLNSAYLIAVGPSADEPRWSSLAHELDGRVIAVGIQKNLGPYFAASDIYLEGFPFGSLTALLEAAQASLAPVLAPAACPLPYRSDDFSLDDLPTPKDTTDYIAIATQLACDPEHSQHLGHSVRRRVFTEHCSPSWTAHLERLRAEVKRVNQHTVNLIGDVEKLPVVISKYWCQFSSSKTKDTAFGFVYRLGMEYGMRPCIDKQLYGAMKKARVAGLNVPTPLKVLYGSWLFSILPTKMAWNVYRWVG